MQDVQGQVMHSRYLYFSISESAYG
jgi:hypothetical protein